jgi:signal transduction histidine kinase
MRHLSTRLLTWFLVVALLPLLVVLLVSHRGYERAMRAEVVDHLVAVAEARGDAIEDYALERSRAVTALARLPGLVAAMRAYEEAFSGAGLDSPTYREVDALHRPFLSRYLRDAGYEDLFLVAHDGAAVFSVRRGEDLGSNYLSGPYRDSELARVFDLARTLMITELSDFAFYPATNQPAAFIASPILVAGDVLGVVVLQVDNEEVWEVVNDTAGLRETGETVVGSIVGEEAVFLTPLRHDPNAAFRLRVPLGGPEAEALQQALRGRRGVVEALDYRGVQVLAAHRYLPSVRWGMVVKLDRAEACGAITRARRQLLLLGLVTLAVVLLVATLISRGISGPIVELTRTTDRIAAGDLTARVDVPLRDEVGRLAGSLNTMAGSLQRLTADLEESRDALELRVQERTHELRRSNAQLERFAYVASHDLQEPLRKVLAFSDRLGTRCESQLDERGKDYLLRMQSAATRMRALIDDLLMFSRIQGSEGRRATVDLGGVVRGVVEDLETRLAETQGRIDVGVLPAVDADPTRMRQLFQNLLGNALKFARPGVPPEVVVQAVAVDGSTERPAGVGAGQELCRIQVIDNGIGFEPKHADRIFGVFQRLHGRSEYEGTGIGLAVCRRIVEGHRGSLTAHSSPGEGATFEVTLPVGGDGNDEDRGGAEV